MNLILFETDDAQAHLPATDPRVPHLLEVLRRKVGDTFDAGVVNGPRGKGTLTSIAATGVTVSFSWGEPPAPLDPIHLLVGLPRPQTGRDILRESATLGVAALHFFRSEKGEDSYAQSSLWSSREWQRQLRTGAAQAFDTRLPEVTHDLNLAEAVAALPSSATRLALDNYEATAPLSAAAIAPPVALAFGPERGWSAAERDRLRAAGFTFVHLGSRVLRCETAVIATVAVIKAKLGLL